jgi:hypothetical protein
MFLAQAALSLCLGSVAMTCTVNPATPVVTLQQIERFQKEEGK